MPLKIRTTGSSEYGQFIRALIAGHGGAGKTLTGSTWPNPFYADANNGLMSIASRRIKTAEIKSMDDMKELRRALDQGPEDREKSFGSPVETLVVDTIDDWQDIIIKERLRSTKRDALSLPDYGWLGERCKEIILAFRNLPMNVVFLAHLKGVNGENADEDDSTSELWPALVGATREKITEYMDLSLVIQARSVKKVVDGKATPVVERVLLSQPDRTYPWLKDRSGRLPAQVEIDFVSDYQRIRDLLFAGISDLPESAERDLILTPPLHLVTEEVDSVPDKPKGGARPLPNRRKAEPEIVVDAQPPEGIDPDTGEVLTEQPAETGVQDEAPTVEDSNTPFSEPETLVCEQCGDPASEKEAMLSRIRFRQVLDDKCYRNQKNGPRIEAADNPESKE